MTRYNTFAIRQTLKLNALLVRYNREESRRFASRAGKLQTRLNTLCANNREYWMTETYRKLTSQIGKLHRQADKLKYEAESFAPATRHALAALAFLKDKPSPCHTSYLKDTEIGALFLNAGGFANKDVALEAAKHCIKGEKLSDFQSHSEDYKALLAAKERLSKLQNEALIREQSFQSDQLKAENARKAAEQREIDYKARAEKAQTEIQIGKAQIEELQKKWEASKVT